MLFGFARLGQLDGAVASMYLLAAVALYGCSSAVAEDRRLAGVALGLAFATKLNVFTLLPAALLWWAVYSRDRSTLARVAACSLVGAA